MIEAHGWVVVRTSRDIYKNADKNLKYINKIDDQVDQEDKKLWKDFLIYLNQNKSPWFKYQFIERHNNVSGILNFTMSRNHRSSVMWDILKWITINGTGSYGIIYVYDDEDNIGITHYGRGQNDFTNCFRVWRILKGKLEELDDPFLSPIIPNINPNEYS